MRFSRIGLFVLTLALAWTATRVFGAPAALTEEEYWTLVAQTREQVAALTGEPPAQVRVGLDGLAAQWSGVTEVELSDGTRVQVNSSYLLAAFQAEEPNLEQLDGLLGALLDAHKTYPQNVFDASDIDPLNSILARPEFQWRTNPVNDWLQRLWDKFAAWLDKILQPFQITVEAPGAGQPLTVVAVIVLLAVLAYVFRGLFTDLVKETDASEGYEDDRNLTSETAFRKAQTLSGQRDYRAAVRYLYLSSLLMMEERGILRYDRSRTNREYLRSVSSHPNLAKPLRSVVDVFDRVWYGFEQLDESTYNEYVNEVEELKEQKQ